MQFSAQNLPPCVVLDQTHPNVSVVMSEAALAGHCIYSSGAEVGAHAFDAQFIDTLSIDTISVH